MNISSKVAIVTGGAEGIGKATAIKLLEKGAKVCFCDINGGLGEKTAAELQEKHGRDNVLFVQCDVTNEKSLEDVFQKTKDKYGDIDILINNAGVMCEGPAWRKAIDINLTAVIDGSKKAEKYMSKHHGGRGGVVVNVASIEGIRHTQPVPVYTASKWGNVGFTRCMAMMSERANTGVRSVCLCPDGANTSLVRNFLAENGVTNPTYPFMSTETVADAMITLIETENNNGGVMTITMKEGTQYVHGGPNSGQE